MFNLTRLPKIKTQLLFLLITTSLQLLFQENKLTLIVPEVVVSFEAAERNEASETSFQQTEEAEEESDREEAKQRDLKNEQRVAEAAAKLIVAEMNPETKYKRKMFCSASPIGWNI